MNDKCKVFISDHDADLADMLSMIVEQDHGCDTVAVTPGRRASPQSTDGAVAVLARIKEWNPDLVILDFVRGHDEHWKVLDQLRIDPDTSSLPILTLSTTEPIIEQTLASYNVHAILTKPFEVDRFSKIVSAILRQPRVTVPPLEEEPGTEVLKEASDLLAKHTREVVGEWLCRDHGIEPFKSRGATHLPNTVDAVPVLLWGTIVALHVSVPAKVFEDHNHFRAAAVEHAQVRKQRGNSLGSLIREYKLLRDATWQVLKDKCPRDRWSADDVFRVGEIVNRALDEMVIIAVQAYGEDEFSKTP